MSKVSVVIDPFRDLHGAWEIVLSGRVRLPMGDALEFEVELLLAQRQPDGRFSISRPAVRRWVGCGQFDLMLVGSTWVDGVGIPDVHPRRNETVVVRARHSDEPLKDDLNRSGRDFPPMSVAGTPCFVLLYELDGERHGRALVPKLEVARALFGTSSDFLLEMMDGIRDGAVATDRGLFDRTLSGPGPDGTVVIMARRRLKRSEAIMIAAYLTDPTLREFYNDVFKSLSVDPDFRAGAAVYIDPQYPFRGETKWEIESGWMEHKEAGRDKPRRVKVVTRIRSIDFPLAFDSIEVHLPAGVTREGAEGLPPRSGRVRTSSSRRASLKTGRAPGRGGRTLELLSSAVGHAHADRVPVVHVAPPPVPQPPMGVSGEETKDETDHSTAGRDGGSKSDVGRATVSRVEPSLEELAEHARICGMSLELTVAALDDAAERAPSIVEWEFEMHSGPGCTCPVPPSSNLDGLYETMLIVEVQSDRGVFLVVDVGSVDLVTRTLAILVPSDGANPAGDDIARVKRFAADGGGHWKGKADLLTGFAIFALHRPRTAKEVAGFGTKLLEKITKALPRAI